MTDLPDWYTQVQGVTLEASSFRSGLDADKPAAPAAGEIWLARDTKKLYVCHAAGSWDCFDASILIQGILTLYADLVAGGYKLTGLGAPTAATDAARKTDVDTVDARLDDVTWSEPIRAVNTNYQNTTGKLKFVAVNVQVTEGSLTNSARAYIGSTSPAGTIVAYAFFDDSTGATSLFQLCFIVPVNWYYRIYATGTVSLLEWHEWDLL